MIDAARSKTAIEWIESTGWEDRLPLLESALDDENQVTLRDHPNRCTSQTTADGTKLLVKRFQRSSPIRWLPRPFLRFVSSGKASREWEIAKSLVALGIRAIPWTAWGFRTLGRTSEDILVAPFLEDSRTLDDPHFLPVISPLIRRSLTINLGRLIGHFHKAGFVHRDLHAGNILVTSEGEPYLIDFHKVLKSRSKSRRSSDLSDFSRYFLLRASRSDRLRFAVAYHASMSSELSLKRWLRSFETEMHAGMIKFLYKRARRPLRGGGLYREIHEKGLSGIAIHSFVSVAPASPSAPRGSSTGTIHKTKRSHVVRETSPGGDLCVKTYNERTFASAVKRIVRGSKAQRAWTSYAALKLRDIPVPDPAYFSQSRFESTVATTFIDSAAHLPEFLEREQEDAIPLLDRLARDLRRLHDLGLRNRDLKGENILVQSTNRYFFVDMDGIMKASPWGLRHRAHDLARLHVSAEVKGSRDGIFSARTRLRFLKIYATSGLSPTLPRRRLRVLLLKRAASIHRRWHRQGPSSCS